MEPRNPLPFSIVDKSCEICHEALLKLCEYESYTDFYETVEIKLHKDSGGRGWHIEGYKLNENDYVDLSQIYDDSYILELASDDLHEIGVFKRKTK